MYMYTDISHFPPSNCQSIQSPFFRHSVFFLGCFASFQSNFWYSKRQQTYSFTKWNLIIAWINPLLAELSIMPSRHKLFLKQSFLNLFHAVIKLFSWLLVRGPFCDISGLIYEIRIMINSNFKVCKLHCPEKAIFCLIFTSQSRRNLVLRY